MHWHLVGLVNLDFVNRIVHRNCLRYFNALLYISEQVVCRLELVCAIVNTNKELAAVRIRA